ncbi:MAG TPA: hypothetical protein VMG10_04830 [Gemmataceae bacterium]|nr:hypothetical protein [Gemmataceae bacterium]
MSWSLRSLLVLLAALTAAANIQAAGKGHKPAAHHAGKASAHVSHSMASAKGRRPAAHHANKTARHVSHTKVNRLARPAVHRHSSRNVRRSTSRTVKPAVKQAAKPTVKRAVARTAHRYSVNRVQRSFVSRPFVVRRRTHHRRYTYSYVPGLYAWRTSYYNRRAVASRRRGSRGVAGVVEMVQGNAVNGTLQVMVLRPRSSRFHYARRKAAAAVATTSHHRFQLNNGTRYEVMTTPRRKGTIADLRKGEHVLILRHPKAAHTAQKVEVLARRKR